MDLKEYRQNILVGHPNPTKFKKGAFVIRYKRVNGGEYWYLGSKFGGHRAQGTVPFLAEVLSKQEARKEWMALAEYIVNMADAKVGYFINIEMLEAHNVEI